MSVYDIKFPAGGSVRREVRAKLQNLGIEYTENKGIMKSEFTAVADGDQHKALMSWFARKSA